MINIAINGFGRIGRAAFKVALESNKVKVIAINDLTDTRTLAHLLKYDTVYGIYNKKVSSDSNHLIVNNKKFAVYAQKEPKNLPWKKLGVKVVLECTGRFTKKEDAQGHLKAGAKKVIISAPSKSDDVATIVRGVNEPENRGEQIISNASCTTNCIAPVMKVLEKEFGVAKSLMTTIHSYTADQNLVDGPHKDLRRARAAGANIVPTTTGAALATCKTIPQLAGKFDGLAVRVPTICGSLADITAVVNKSVTVDKVNNAFKKASRSYLKGILDVTQEPLVSSDVVGNEYSAVVDLNLTKVIGDDLVKVIAWYDNEWAYAKRLVEVASEVM
ncbi:type I glyceraldehyde-3-phosphate dehydrogenase [Patescibacteria group bacterium]|nr:type I glyceraldehyde-3-phosphate dehydrogenase [Patescibacteria group bacterium]MBU4512429.1 type I glyceraldehyde-3-phosphate dehydrogenase [Patescibacteria group bacterium]MCG2692723.1 type I glyceraldehyde-3-phosphate dehydrogenase [Candidatus Parcubacteria bacterium]